MQNGVRSLLAILVHYGSLWVILAHSVFITTVFNNLILV